VDTIYNVDENAPWRNDPIARDMALAVREYNIHNRKGKEEIKFQQAAIIAYGKALLKGRKRYSSNRDFKKWIIDWDFNTTPPFNNPRERSEAMRIAEIIFRTGTEDCFANCDHKVPSNMMTWARKAGLVPRKKRNPNVLRQAREQARGPIENGETIGRNKIAEEIGVSNSTVDIAIALERGRVEGIVEAEALALNEQGKLTKTQAKHVEALIKKYRRDLDQQFATALEAEVTKRVEERKTSLDKAREACNEQKNKAFAEQQRWKKLINGHKTLFTMEEFRVIVMALHPDNSASEETRARALQSFTDKKLQLTGKA
jgi:hypothetical protein